MAQVSATHTALLNFSIFSYMASSPNPILKFLKDNSYTNLDAVDFSVSSEIF